jgi:hypothetical protein
VRACWTRQFETIDPHVEPQALSGDEHGGTVVDVHQVVHDLDGGVIAGRRSARLHGQRRT